MYKKHKNTRYIEISHDSVLADKELLCDVYAFLSLNDRMIRVRSKSQHIENKILENYKNKGHKTFFVLNPEHNENAYEMKPDQDANPILPGTIDKEAPDEELISLKPVKPAPVDSDFQIASYAKENPDESIEASESLKENPAENIEVNASLKENKEAENIAISAKGKIEENTSDKTISGNAKLSQDKDEDDLVVGGDASELPEEQKFSAESEDLEEQKFSSDPALKQENVLVSGKTDLVDNEAILVKDNGEATIDNEKITINGTSEEEIDELTKISGAPLEAEEVQLVKEELEQLELSMLEVGSLQEIMVRCNEFQEKCAENPEFMQFDEIVSFYRNSRAEMESALLSAGLSTRMSSLRSTVGKTIEAAEALKMIASDLEEKNEENMYADKIADTNNKVEALKKKAALIDKEIDVLDSAVNALFEGNKVDVRQFPQVKIEALPKTMGPPGQKEKPKDIFSRFRQSTQEVIGIVNKSKADAEESQFVRGEAIDMSNQDTLVGSKLDKLEQKINYALQFAQGNGYSDEELLSYIGQAVVLETQEEYRELEDIPDLTKKIFRAYDARHFKSDIFLREAAQILRMAVFYTDQKKVVTGKFTIDAKLLKRAFTIMSKHEKNCNPLIMERARQYVTKEISISERNSCQSKAKSIFAEVQKIASA